MQSNNIKSIYNAPPQQDSEGEEPGSRSPSKLSNTNFMS